MIRQVDHPEPSDSLHHRHTHSRRAAFEIDENLFIPIDVK